MSSRDRQSLLVDKALALYGQGWFPMFDDERRVVEWVQPHERGLLPLDERLRVPRSLRQRVRSGKFIITCDQAFGRVIRECGTPAHGRERTWLCSEIIDLFETLHAAGHAHSVEAWVNDTLVGGLYGLALGGAFCGESMFSRPDLGGTDASKVCLVHLVEHLRSRGFVLLDAQLHNEHLEQFGLYEVPMDAYTGMLKSATGVAAQWGEFDPGRALRAVRGEGER